MKTIMLVRHADVDPHVPGGPTDPSLNAAGQARAQELARVLGAQPISAAFASPFARTQQTITPAAQKNHLTVQVIATEDETVAKALDAASGPVVLIGGHSNTVPAMIQKLGLPFASGDLAGFDNLFVVSIAAGDKGVTWLKYGA